MVIDSVACPFRHGFDDMGMRNRILSGMAQNLIKLATLDNVAVSSYIHMHIHTLLYTHMHIHVTGCPH